MYYNLSFRARGRVSEAAHRLTDAGLVVTFEGDERVGVELQARDNVEAITKVLDALRREPQSLLPTEKWVKSLVEL